MGDLFELLDEVESADACTWHVQLIDGEGRIHHHTFRLSWADYDVFAPGGSTPPAKVAEATVRFMLGREEFQPLPERIDAAVPRRRVPGADELITQMIRD